MPAEVQTEVPTEASSGMSGTDVLGYRVEAVPLAVAAERVITFARGVEPKLVVTLNPEIVVQAEADPDLARAIRSADLIVADGVGILWAARRAGRHLPGRVPGVELTEEALRLGGPDLRVYLLGARPGVAEQAAARVRDRFGTQVVGTQHGYFRRPEDVANVVDDVRSSGPHLLLAGLGEGQERFLSEHLAALGVPVAIGVGGTIDVLAGAAKRTPAWTRALGVEWAWRVGLDPKRWHRIPRLVRFAQLVLSQRRRPSEPDV